MRRASAKFKAFPCYKSRKDLATTFIYNNLLALRIFAIHLQHI
jgi:hypothetical protein